METALFIAKTIAGAILGTAGKEAYAAVKTKLVDVFGLGRPVAALEEQPNDPAELQYLASKIESSGAMADEDFREKVALLAEALRDATDQPAAAQVIIEDIKASEGVIERMRAEGSAAVTVRNLESDTLIVRDVTAKS